MREGTYLELYPNGTHAGGVITKIDELLRYFTHDIRFLQHQMHSELSSEDHSRFKKLIAEFRKVIMKITNPNYAFDVARDKDEAICKALQHRPQLIIVKLHEALDIDPKNPPTASIASLSADVRV